VSDDRLDFALCWRSSLLAVSDVFLSLNSGYDFFIAQFVKEGTIRQKLGQLVNYRITSKTFSKGDWES
jgi:hypothetical protein